MQYELYIDVFFLINAIMDWMLLKITGKILSCKVGKMRILWGAFLGAFLTCIVWSIPGIPGILKLLFFYTFVNVVMIQAGLGIRRSRELVRAFIVLGISAVLMAGILSLFRQYIRYGSLFWMCDCGGLPGRWNSLDVTAVVQKEIRNMQNPSGACGAEL